MVPPITEGRPRRSGSIADSSVSRSASSWRRSSSSQNVCGLAPSEPSKASLEGPLWVRYDQDDQCFKMRDEKTEEEVIGVEIGQDIYVSPAQNGEL